MGDRAAARRSVRQPPSEGGRTPSTTLLDACDDTGVTRAGLDPDDVLLLVGFLWRIDPNADWEERTGRMLDIVIDGLRKQSVG